MHLTAAQRDAALRNGIDLTLDRPVPADVRKIRVVVQDTQSGAVGSLTVPLVTP